MFSFTIKSIVIVIQHYI